MAAARDSPRASMDIDKDARSSPAPAPAPSFVRKNSNTPNHTSNGVNGSQKGQRSPTPPPHKSNPTTAEADSFKLAGNKAFKAGDYNNAILEYNKGGVFLFLGFPPLVLSY